VSFTVGTDAYARHVRSYGARAVRKLDLPSNHRFSRHD
jgi:hypothetical protein